MKLDEGFLNVSEKELMEINGGGWNQFGKVLTGTLLLAGGVIVMALPGGAIAGLGMASFGASGICSGCK